MATTTPSTKAAPVEVTRVNGVPYRTVECFEFRNLKRFVVDDGRHLADVESPLGVFFQLVQKGWTGVGVGVGADTVLRGVVVGVGHRGAVFDSQLADVKFLQWGERGDRRRSCCGGVRGEARWER